MGSLVLASLLALTQPMPLWWFGMGGLVGAAGWAWTTWRDELERARCWLARPRQLGRSTFTLSSALAELACLALVVALASAMLPEAALGDRPVDHDHPVHYFKAWQLWTDFVTQGRLHGWSHRWFAGYPVPYHYPVGGDLWVLGVRASSLGALSLGQAYGVAIWLVWAFSGWAVYRLGAQAFEDRRVGLLAALFYMTDDGSFRASGWSFTMYWGVWPQSLAIALGTMSVAELIRTLRTGSRWAWSGFAGLLGASLVTHPLLIFHFAAVGPLALIGWAISSERDRPFLGGALRVVAGYGVGIALAGFWLFPYLAFKDYAASNTSVLWKTLFGLSISPYRLDTLDGALAPVVALGALGTLGALATGRRLGPFLVGTLATLFLFAGTKDFVAAFHLYEALDAFRYVHLQRFQIMSKPYFMIGAGWAIVGVLGLAWRALRERDGEPLEARRGALLLQGFVFGTLIGPLVAYFAYNYALEDVQRQLIEESSRPHRAARERMIDWFQARLADDDRFWRVGIDTGKNEHSLHDLATRLDRPFYKIGFTPAATFRYKMGQGDPALLRALNVRYVITSRPWRSPGFERIERFGPWHVHEDERWSPDPFAVQGQGAVELERFEPDEIVLQAGPEASGHLELRVSHYPSWRLTRDGEPVEITPVEFETRDEDKEVVFMRAPLAPGTYRFTFEAGLVEWGSLMGSLLALLVLLGVPLYGPRLLERGPGARAWRLGRGWVMCHEGVVAAVVFGVPLHLAVGALLWLAWWDPPLPGFEERVARVHLDMADQLGDATVDLARQGQRQRLCRRWFDRHFCGPEPWQHPHPRLEPFEGEQTLRCIWAHPLEGVTLRYQYDDVPAGDALIGFHTISGRRDTPVKLRVAVDGRVQEEMVAQRNGQISEFVIPLQGDPETITFLVSADDITSRELCFNAQVVDLKGGP